MTLTSRIAEQLRKGFAEHVLVHGDAISTGFRASTGRFIPLLIKPVMAGGVVVSDGGETWSELAADGFVRWERRSNEAVHAEKLAQMFKLEFDLHTGELQTAVSVSKVHDAALRVVSASVAMDAWRALWHPHHPRVINRNEVATALEEIAPRHGWLPRRGLKIVGESRHEYTTDFLLERMSQRAALVSAPGDVEVVVHTALCWSLDTSTPVVILTRQKVVERLNDAPELRGKRIALVGRQGQETVLDILNAAARIQEAA